MNSSARRITSVVIRSAIKSRSLRSPSLIASRLNNILPHSSGCRQLPKYFSSKAEKVDPDTVDDTPDKKAAGEEKPPGDGKSMEDFDYDNYDDYEPRTAGEKVAVYSRLAGMLLLLGIGGVGIYYIFDALNPGRMGPHNVYYTAIESVKLNDKIMMLTGEPVTTFGKDGTEGGRRLVLDSREYTAEDGSKRTRVRFNIKGPKGQFLVWAEVSNKMAHNEYVYLICQDRRTRRVYTLQDNRARLEAERLTMEINDNSYLTQLRSYFGI